MEDHQQITALIEHSVADLKRSGRELLEVTFSQFPVLPRLRATPRYITKTLGVCFNNAIIRTINDGVTDVRPIIRTINGVTDVRPISFFIRMRSEKRVKDFTRVRKALGYKRQASIWGEISETDFIKYMVKCCTTPRKVVRALARMDSYVRWMQDRIRGLEAARENILIAQQPWVDRINARISGIELSGANLSVRFHIDNPISCWPAELRECYRTNNKIDAIKLVRELAINQSGGVGSSLAEAKLYVERAFAILDKYGADAVYMSSKPFKEWHL